jgi:hypothetical protein
MQRLVNETEIATTYNPIARIYKIFLETDSAALLRQFAKARVHSVVTSMVNQNKQLKSPITSLKQVATYFTKKSETIG